MEILLLHLYESRNSQICTENVESEYERRNGLDDMLEACLPYLNQRDRASSRTVCKAWKRVIDGLRKPYLPGRLLLYATSLPEEHQSQVSPLKRKLSHPQFLRYYKRICSNKDVQKQELINLGSLKNNVELISLGSLEHMELVNPKEATIVVAKHLVGFIGRNGVLVFNPLATEPDLAYIYTPTSKVMERPTFFGIHLEADAAFTVVVGWLIQMKECMPSYIFIHPGDSGTRTRLPENMRNVNTGPTGSATFFQGNLYWPTRVGEVVKLDIATGVGGSWTQLGKPSSSGGDFELLWFQGLFVWNNNLYYLGYVRTGCGEEVNKIWKLNPGLSSHAWDEQEMLPSHPCSSSALPPEIETSMMEFVLVVPWTKGGQASGKHELSRLHAGILAYNRSCSKWWWVSHCIHLWGEGGIVSRITPSVLNEFEFHQEVAGVHKPSSTPQDTTKSLQLIRGPWFTAKALL